MKNNTLKTPLTIALGAVLVGSVANVSVANAASNPFSMTELPGGYMVAEMEGKCGEGKCGASKMKGKMKEGKCGEGKCGGMKGKMKAMMDADGDGKVSKQEFMDGHETMFSKKDANGDGFIDGKEMEGMCGGMKAGEGKCGGSKGKMKEGKCGEGKCGGNK